VSVRSNVRCTEVDALHGSSAAIAVARAVLPSTSATMRGLLETCHEAILRAGLVVAAAVTAGTALVCPTAPAYGIPAPAVCDPERAPNGAAAFAVIGRVQGSGDRLIMGMTSVLHLADVL
jgi:hypothetical protein